ncbi:hypothetical protein ACE6H2_023486 [Prunus campanulata]
MSYLPTHSRISQYKLPINSVLQETQGDDQKRPLEDATRKEASSGRRKVRQEFPKGGIQVPIRFLRDAG